MKHVAWPEVAGRRVDVGEPRLLQRRVLVEGIRAGLEVSRSQCEIAHRVLEPVERLLRGERRVRGPPRQPLQDCDSGRVGANLLKGLEASVQTCRYVREARRPLLVLVLVLVTRAGIPHLQAVLQVLLREGDIVSHRLGQVAQWWWDR